MAERPAHSLRVVHGVDALEHADGRLFVVLGVFDGLHRGHAYLLRVLRREAARRGARPTVLTFDAHPDEVIAGRAPAVLCDPDERLVRFARAGVDVVVVAHFDRTVRETPYDAFVRQIAERVELAGFLMTPDAAFGYERRGTAEAIAALGGTLEPPFDVAVVPTLTVDGEPVRSSTIRAAIAAGDLATARRLLGRSVAVTGRVRLAADSPRRAREVTFDLPPALPPDGRYRAGMEPAWSLDRGGGPVRPRIGQVVVEGDRVVIERVTAVAPDGRLRVAFRARFA
jgi:riboflavin kinase/FMN adenylyltransferase